MDIHSIAKSIREAKVNGKPIEPIRKLIGMDDISVAYQIQQINTMHRINSGAKVAGKKIGLTSRAVQQQLGVNQPDFGTLFKDMEILNGQSYPIKNILQGKAEAEFAFRLKYTLDTPSLTIADIMHAIDFVVPAIEIAGSRIRDWDIGITDTIADNASASHFVLGHTPRYLHETDLITSGMKMYQNDNLVSQGNGRACMGSPLNAVHWLAATMQEHGSPLQVGEIILSGALGKFIDIHKGDVIRAEFEEFGEVSVQFE